MVLVIAVIYLLVALIMGALAVYIYTGIFPTFVVAATSEEPFVSSPNPNLVPSSAVLFSVFFFCVVSLQRIIDNMYRVFSDSRLANLPRLLFLTCTYMSFAWLVNGILVLLFSTSCGSASDDTFVCLPSAFQAFVYQFLNSVGTALLLADYLEFTHSMLDAYIKDIDANVSTLKKLFVLHHLANLFSCVAANLVGVLTNHNWWLSVWL